MGRQAVRTQSGARGIPQPPACDRRSHARSHRRAAHSGSRAGLLVLLAAAILAICAASASAVVVHLPNGKTLSYQPLRGAAPAPSTFSTFAKKSKNLLYHGGPIMPSNTNYTLYWAPTGSPAYPAEYQSGVDKYLADLAHDSGGVQNVDSVSAQYNDGAGELAKYKSTFGGRLTDTQPYPTNGCHAVPLGGICLTSTQLEEEIARYVKANGLPHDLTHEYFLLTPPGVEDCAEELTGECSAGSTLGAYCAYHSFIPVTGGSIIYSNDPFVTGNPGCDDGEHPSNKPSDGALQGGLSHEHNESITDPELNAWFGPEGNENGDKCRTFEEASEFGTPLGKAPDGARYNQVVNTDLYWYQQEWSNEGTTCKQRALATEPPTVKRVSPKKGPAAGGTAVVITGTNFAQATAVTFGSLPAAGFTITSGTTINAVSPPEAKGSVNVTVSNAFGSSPITRRDHFKFVK
jgi:IPT/TIG domain-containing protein